jgi:glycine reductase complex component B subunit gamma
VISQEIEKVGIPTAIITTLIPTARLIGAYRIVPGFAITHPVGNPGLSASKERDVRRTIVLKALESLQDTISDGKVFNWQ